MKKQNETKKQLSRRAFIGSSITAMAAFSVTSGSVLAGVKGSTSEVVTTKPNSVFNGVHIGVITYNLRGVDTSAEGMLSFLTQAGLSEVELMGVEATSYMSSSSGRGAGGRAGTPAPAAQLSEAEIQTLRAQRYVQLGKALDMRKMYNDAGVNIHFHKINFGQTEEDIDFNFQVAKALGCVGITLERSEEQVRRLAPYADKHKIWLVLHNHTNNYPQLDPDDPILQYGKYVGFNFDSGHYFAGSGGKSPIPIIEKYHNRIISIHLKDRTGEGGNLPWGQGKTPICEILKLIAKEKWPIYCDIELEYQYQNSDALTEIKKCVEYCRNCLS